MIAWKNLQESGQSPSGLTRISSCWGMPSATSRPPPGSFRQTLAGSEARSREITLTAA